MMNIRISTESLSGSSENLLWSGALYGLKRLQEFDHQLFFLSDDLSRQQQQLLENEKITSVKTLPDAIDLQIIAEKNDLEALDNNGSEIETAPDWIALSNKICFPTRKASRERTTAETDISITVNLDGSGQSNVSTGLDFLDHMLEQIARHGLIDLDISCDGDLEVDEHHTIEDVAITLGTTIDDALGNKIGIQRYGFALPMDETLATVALDFSGRPYLEFDGSFSRDMVGDFPTEMVEHFFYSLAINLQATLHIAVDGKNDHHQIEGCFKGFARCLRAAVSRNERNLNVLPTTKNLL
jgi:imidazoleglycerol-phosphate dehydratase/histidinol-phosphatase